MGNLGASTEALYYMLWICTRSAASEELFGRIAQVPRRIIRCAWSIRRSVPWDKYQSALWLYAERASLKRSDMQKRCPERIPLRTWFGFMVL